MDATTLQALVASVEKWDRNAQAVSPADAQIHGDSCALCEIFADPDCAGCPVRESSGKPECKLTPWRLAFESLGKWMLDEMSEIKAREFRLTAKAEADFLRSLIPGGAA